MKTLFIIPTYNEVENIKIIIPELFNTISDIDVLVVDDNSPDGTSKAVEQLQKRFNHNLYLIIQKEKEGLRKAYVTGFQWVIKKKYDWIFEMDADYSHTPKDAKRILDYAINKQIDVCVGSRFLKEGKVVDWPLSRKLLSYAALIYTKLITGLPIFDPTAGFVCYSYRYLSSIKLDKISCSGYGFQVEMKFVAWKLGFKLGEIPITFQNRKYGVSKMSSDIIFEAITSILRLQWKFILGKIKYFYLK